MRAALRIVRMERAFNRSKGSFGLAERLTWKKRRIYQREA